MSERERLLQRLERFRPNLRLQAQLWLGSRLRSKLDPSDVVQDALLAAVKDYEKYRGGEGEELAWLRSILANQLLHVSRDFRTRKRNIALEQSLEASDDRLASLLPTDDSTPSERAMREERVCRVAACLGTLLEEERYALIKYYFFGASRESIARDLGRSPAAVAGLITRGQKRFREHWSE